MEVFEIWSAGYVATGQRAGPTKLANIEAEDFKSACDKLAERNSQFDKYYNPEDLTYWGCALCSSLQEAARKTPG